MSADPLFGFNMPKRSLVGLADRIADDAKAVYRKPSFLDKLSPADVAELLEVAERWLNGQLGNSKAAVVKALVKHGVSYMSVPKFNTLVARKQKELEHGQESHTSRRRRRNNSKR